MKTCPNKSSLEWKTFVKLFGEDNTWKIWIKNDDNLPNKEIAAYQLFMDNEPKEAAGILTKNLPEIVKSTISFSTKVDSLVSKASLDLFSDKSFNNWLSRNKYDINKDIKIAEGPEQVTEEETLFSIVNDVPEVNIYQSNENMIKILQGARAEEIIARVSDKFSKETGMTWSTIHEADAIQLLTKFGMKYTGQVGFVISGVPYFIKDKIDLNTTVADIAQPLLKALDIRDQKLIPGFYEDLEATVEGQEIIEKVKTAHPDLAVDSETFKIEAIAQALEYTEELNRALKANPNITQPALSKSFQNITSRVLQNFRSEFRRVFKANINQGAIHLSTPLNTLADVLSKGDLIVDMPYITQDNVGMLANSLKKQVSEMVEAIENTNTRKNFHVIVNSLYNLLRKESETLKHKELWDVKKDLYDEEHPDVGILGQAFAHLKYIKTVGKTPEQIEKIEGEDLTSQAINLVKAIAQTEAFVTKLRDILYDINLNERDSKVALGRVQYFTELLQDAEAFIDGTTSDMVAAGIPITTSVYTTVSNISAPIKEGLKYIKEIREKHIVNAIHDIIKDQTASVIEDYDKQIAAIKKKGSASDPVLQAQIERLTKEREEFLLPKEKITALIKGQGGDANFWHSMFVNYAANPDPIIASLTKLIKDTVYTAASNYYRVEQALENDIQPLLDKLGITGTNVVTEQAFLAQEDKSYQIIDGVATEYIVKALLQPTKNSRWGVKQLEVNIDKALETGDREKLRQAIKERNDHLVKWFTQEYESRFYTAQNKLTETKAGLDAWIKRNAILDEIKIKSGESFSEYEAFMKYDEESVLWDKYKKLFSLYDDFGILKSDEAPEGESSDLAMAKELQLHRLRTSYLYEYKERPRAFETALEAFEQELELRNPGKKVSDPEWFKNEVNTWINQNTVKGFTPEYYSLVAMQYEELGKLAAQLPKEFQEKYDVAGLYKDITDMLSSEKDMYGQPSRANMKDQKFTKIKDIQERINKLREEMDLKSGLSLQELAERDQLDDFFRAVEEGESDAIITDYQKNRRHELTLKQIENQKTASIGRAMAHIFKILGALKGKIPTKEYLEIVNNYTPVLGIKPLDETTAKGILDKDVAEELMEKDATFAKWFMENHIKSPFVDYKTKKKTYRYERVAVWSVAIPKNPAHKLTTTLTRIDPITNKPVVLDGAPNLKYKFRVVKDKYRTIKRGLTDDQKYDEYVIKKKIIDNQGHFLPKTQEQLLEDGITEVSPYHNEDYYRLKKESPDKFKLLQHLTNFHLENQKGTIYGGKLYLDMPRYRVSDNAELLQRGIISRQIGQRVDTMKNMVNSLRKKDIAGANKGTILAGDPESGSSNYELLDSTEDLESLQSMTFGRTSQKIPIEGISKMSMEDASVDFITSIRRYGMSAYRQKALMAIDPISKGMLQVVKDNPVNDISTVQNFQQSVRNAITSSSTKQIDSMRFKTLDSLNKREFEGKLFDENSIDGLNKATGKILGAASFNYFALNFTSAIKNYWGILWQLNIEAAAGEYMDFRSLGKGKVWAKRAMKEWSTSLYGGKNNSLEVQIARHFDPMQGKSADSHAQRTSRNLFKDILSLSWLYSPRKFMEMEGAFQLFGGMMAHKLIDRVVGGKTTKIAYIDAFELNKEGFMTLKSGINKEYDINGKEFIQMRNLVHEKGKDLNGSFSKFDKPQAQRVFAYRLFMFMRGYFTDMFLHRFGTNRVNFMMGKARRGYYIESLLTIAKIMKTFGAHMKYMSFSEKRAGMKMMSDLGQIMITSFIVSTLFGYDDDDPDRFAKMKARSGALGTEEFDPLGYLTNHTLTLLVKTQNENESFIPLPGFGLTDYVGMANAGSIAFNPTVKNYAKILTDIAGHLAPGEDASQFYKRDVGPYPWQQEGSAKIWNHIFTSIGVTGSDVDAGVKAMKGFETTQNIR